MQTWPERMTNQRSMKHRCLLLPLLRERNASDTVKIKQDALDEAKKALDEWKQGEYRPGMDITAYAKKSNRPRVETLLQAFHDRGWQVFQNKDVLQSCQDF